ncbi:MAG: endopeptidase La [Candidatus Magnetomorum sp.]|nr:endopeptidase La [Candidatus Magnetomorum sp.]
MFISKFKKASSQESNTYILPLIPLRDIVVFPFVVFPLFVGRQKSVKALTYAMQNNKQIFLANQTKTDLEDPKEKDIHTFGTVGRILQLVKLPDGTVKTLIEGIARAKIVRFLGNTDIFEIELEPSFEQEIDTQKAEALTRAMIEKFELYSQKNKTVPQDLVRNIAAIKNPSQLADTISAHFPFKLEDKKELLKLFDPNERITVLIQKIVAEIDIFEMEKKITGRVQKQIDKTQRNYYLNEKMRAIKKEMGTDPDPKDDYKDLEKRLKRKKMSKEASSKVRQEFQKLKMMQPMSSEATVVRNYIEWLIDLPWFHKKKTWLDIDKSEKILNEDHYGLEKPKERILEYLAVQSLVKRVRGPILCLVGPPGVGKTSLAKSVARATNREFVRLSLGGVRDEAEIRGHRRTYIGAMPGKIIQSLKKVKVNNPVFCLDEVDKMSMDFRGDPSSALLEVLDPEQNDTFNDHYLDVDYDLSDIMFITTANTLHEIPLPLQDRMEIIRLSGYTEIEKHHIATDFLIPKQAKQNGLKKEQIEFPKETIVCIIRNYTKEAGVRNLEREIAAICRKVAREFVSKNDAEKSNFHVTINEDLLNKHLGPYKYRYGQVETKDHIGLVTGLAWTQYGGELLCVETVIMPGKGKLLVTGKLGEVMKESAQAAFSYVRSRSQLLILEEEFYQKYDIHLHVPEGAIPKDGPSAGITMCTSIVSALLKKPVNKEIAMTGEITLRGRVLPIGGLKEKILAAHRGGIKTIIVPDENKKDLQDIPEIILNGIELIWVAHMDDVLKQTLDIDPAIEAPLSENKTCEKELPEETRQDA